MVIIVFYSTSAFPAETTIRLTKQFGAEVSKIHILIPMLYPNSLIYKFLPIYGAQLRDITRRKMFLE